MSLDDSAAKMAYPWSAAAPPPPDRFRGYRAGRAQARESGAGRPKV